MESRSLPDRLHQLGAGTINFYLPTCQGGGSRLASVHDRQQRRLAATNGYREREAQLPAVAVSPAALRVPTPASPYVLSVETMRTDRPPHTAKMDAEMNPVNGSKPR